MTTPKHIAVLKVAHVPYNAYVMGTIATQEYHHLPAKEVLQALDTNEEGLTPTEAARRLAAHDPNTATAISTKQWHYALWRRTNPLILLQVASSLLLYALDEPVPATALLVLAVLQAGLHIARESHSGQPAKALRQLIPKQAHVVRAGDRHTVPARDLTVGDIVYLTSGDIVPADLRIIEEEQLQITATALTGQAGSRRKYTHTDPLHAPLADRHNMALCGSVVTAGHALGVVVATGKHTALAQLMQATTRPATTLTQKTDAQRLSWRLAQAISVLGIILLPLAAVSGLEAQSVLLFAALLIAAAIPFGLPGAITMLLAQTAGVLRHLQLRIRRLSAVEQLSATSTIIADISTLTTGGRKAEHLHMGRQVYTVDKDIRTNADTPLSTQEKQAINLLCTAAALTIAPRNHNQHTTSSTYEKAVISLAHTAGITMQHLGKLYREIQAFPYSTQRGRASSIRYFGDKKQQKPHVFVTGTPTSMYDRCTKIWDDGRLRPLTHEDIQQLKKAVAAAQRTGQQSIAVAYRILPSSIKAGRIGSEAAEHNLVWLGTIQLADTLHRHITNTIASLQQAHIKLSLIAPGPAVTAQAVALQAGLAAHRKDIQTLSGHEVSRLSNSHLLHVIHAGNAAFYDVSPEQKQRLAHIAQQGGKIVALTGNTPADLPALHTATMSVGLTQSPASVTQSTALTLLDNNLTSLAHGILTSRITFQKLRLAVLAALTSTAAKVCIVVGSLIATTFASVPPALSAIHLLVLSVLVELLPLATIGRDPAEGDPATEYPRSAKERLLTRERIVDIAWVGVLISAAVFVNYLLFFGRYDIPAGHVPASSLLHTKAMTLALVISTLCLLVAMLQRRFSTGLLSRKQLRNGWLWLACLLSLATMYCLIYVPALAEISNTAPLQTIDWLYAGSTMVAFALIRELQLHSKKHSRKAVLELHRNHRLRTKKTVGI